MSAYGSWRNSTGKSGQDVDGNSTRPELSRLTSAEIFLSPVGIVLDCLGETCNFLIPKLAGKARRTANPHFAGRPPDRRPVARRGPPDPRRRRARSRAAMVRPPPACSGIEGRGFGRNPLTWNRTGALSPRDPSFKSRRRDKALIGALQQAGKLDACAIAVLRANDLGADRESAVGEADRRGDGR